MQFDCFVDCSLVGGQWSRDCFVQLYFNFFFQWDGKVAGDSFSYFSFRWTCCDRVVNLSEWVVHVYYLKEE